MPASGIGGIFGGALGGGDEIGSGSGMGAGAGPGGKYCARASTGSPIHTVNRATLFHHFAMALSPTIPSGGYGPSQSKNSTLFSASHGKIGRITRSLELIVKIAFLSTWPFFSEIV
jgi:hypothetical protein